MLKPPFPKLELLESTDSGRPNYRLEEDYAIDLDGVVLLVKSGYVTDLASLPRFAFVAWEPNDRLTVAAALVHDALYSSQGGSRKHDLILVSAKVSRWKSDKHLRTLMRASGCSQFRSTVYWLAVRAFGKQAWKDLD